MLSIGGWVGASFRGAPVAVHAASSSAIPVTSRRRVSMRRPGPPTSLVSAAPARHLLAEFERGPPDPPAFSAPLGRALSGPGDPGRLAPTGQKSRDRKQSEEPHDGPPPWSPALRRETPGPTEFNTANDRGGTAVPGHGGGDRARRAAETPAPIAPRRQGPYNHPRERSRCAGGDLVGPPPG